jgi:hypothetical protein
MARDRRLRQAEGVVDVADADLVVRQQREDAKPRLVSQRLEDVFQLVDRRPAFCGGCPPHIFALTNVSSPAYIRQYEY